MLAVREQLIKQESQDEMSNHYGSILPGTGEEDASMRVTPSFSLLDDEGGFVQIHTKNESEQPESSATLMDAAFVKQEIDAADYLLVDQIEVAEDEDSRGEQTDEQKIATFSDAVHIVKSQDEETDIGEEDSNISDTSEKREQDEKRSNKETGHTCSVCGKVFEESQACLRHMWQNHTGEKPYTCHICGKDFKYISSFNIHKITHSSDRPYSCDQCPKTFKRKDDVQTHVARCHSDERPFSCDVCGKTFKQKFVLQQHRAAKHSNERPYSCDLCDKTFKLKSILQHHRAAKHSNEKPHSCDVCAKTFKRKGDVRKHKAICHSDERQYSCDLCGKSFKRKDVAQKHMARCHSDERPYSCKLSLIRLLK